MTAYHAYQGKELHEVIRSTVASVLNRHGARASIYLFGSEVAGPRRPASDIDVGLMGDGPLSAALLQRIEDELEELPTLRSFDVVDFAGVPSERREGMLQDAILLGRSD